MFVFLFLCIYTNPATGCYMNKTILCCVFFSWTTHYSYLQKTSKSIQTVANCNVNCFTKYSVITLIVSNDLQMINSFNVADNLEIIFTKIQLHTILLLHLVSFLLVIEDLEIYLRNHSRSLQMAPFNRTHRNSHSSSCHFSHNWARWLSYQVCK